MKQPWFILHQMWCRLVMAEWCSPKQKPYSEGLHWSSLPLWSQLRTLCIMQRLHYFSRNTGPSLAPSQAEPGCPLSGILLLKAAIMQMGRLLFNPMGSILCRTPWINWVDLHRRAIWLNLLCPAHSCTNTLKLWTRPTRFTDSVASAFGFIFW